MCVLGGGQRSSRTGRRNGSSSTASSSSSSTACPRTREPARAQRCEGRRSWWESLGGRRPGEGRPWRWLGLSFLWLEGCYAGWLAVFWREGDAEGSPVGTVECHFLSQVTGCVRGRGGGAVDERKRRRACGKGRWRRRLGRA
eukprot:3934791-Rhodomonas_salina.1